MRWSASCRTRGLLLSLLRFLVALAILSALRCHWLPGGDALVGPCRRAGLQTAARCSGPAVATSRQRRRSQAIGRAAYSEAVPIDKQYPHQALHGHLFNPAKVEEWLLPEVRQALAAWRESGDPRDVDLEALPGARLEAPGVFSFRLLDEGVCKSLLEEVGHYATVGFPAVAPNSMNRHGAILNDIGLRPCFTRLLGRHLAGIGARLFGDDAHRAETLFGEPLGTDNWGGSTLANHHTFVVQYAPDTDRGLDMHVDECDVTWNIGLALGGAYEGGDLAFCGMFGQPGYRQLHLSYRHDSDALGRCVVHSGKRRHCVTPVEAGKRASLIMWTHSILWRGTEEYRSKCGDIAAGRAPWPEEAGPPDPVCLSLTHDKDYFRWSRLL